MGKRRTPESGRPLDRRRFLTGLGAAAIGAAGLDGGWPGRAVAQTQTPGKDRRMTRFGIQIEPQFGFSYHEVAGPGHQRRTARF